MTTAGLDAVSYVLYAVVTVRYAKARNTPATLQSHLTLGRNPGSKSSSLEERSPKRPNRDTSWPVEATWEFRTILVQLSRYTHDHVNNHERFVVYSSEHGGHANAQCAFTPVPVSRPLALDFKSGLFLSTTPDDARARSRMVAFWMLIGAPPVADSIPPMSLMHKLEAITR